MTKHTKCKSIIDLVQMSDFAIFRGLYQDKPKSYVQNRATPYKLVFPEIADCSPLPWVIFCFIHISLTYAHREI